MTKKGVSGDILMRYGTASSGGYENVPPSLSHEDSTPDEVSQRQRRLTVINDHISVSDENKTYPKITSSMIATAKSITSVLRGEINYPPAIIIIMTRSSRTSESIPTF